MLFRSVTNYIVKHMPEIKEFIRSAFEKAEEVIDLTSGAINSLTEFFKEHWSIMEPILFGIGAGATVFGIYTLAINAAAIATGIWSGVTGVATAVGTAFGAVLAFITSPIGLVVIAIGLLVAAGVALYKNWDTVSEFLKKAWNWIKDTATKIFTDVKDKIVGAFQFVKDKVLGVWKGIVDGIKGYINNIISAINGMVSKVADSINAVTGLINKIPGVNIPKVQAPQIPKLATGTNHIPSDGLYYLHEGEEVKPKKYVDRDKESKVTFERGAFEGAIIFDDYGVDRVMDRVVERLRGKMPLPV